LGAGACGYGSRGGTGGGAPSCRGAGGGPRDAPACICAATAAARCPAASAACAGGSEGKRPSAEAPPPPAEPPLACMAREVVRQAARSRAGACSNERVCAALHKNAESLREQRASKARAACCTRCTASGGALRWLRVTWQRAQGRQGCTSQAGRTSLASRSPLPFTAAPPRSESTQQRLTSTISASLL